MNPVKAGLVERPEEYPYSSARLRAEVDPAPQQFHRNPGGKAGDEIVLLQQRERGRCGFLLQQSEATPGGIPTPAMRATPVGALLRQREAMPVGFLLQ